MVTELRGKENAELTEPAEPDILLYIQGSVPQGTLKNRDIFQDHDRDIQVVKQYKDRDTFREVSVI